MENPAITFSQIDIANLIKELGSFSAKKRERATQILANRQGESLEPLLTSLSEEAIVYQMQSEFAYKLWRCRWIVFFAIMCVILIGDKEIIDNISPFFLTAVLSPTILVGVGKAVSCPSRRFSALLKIVENSNEPRIIGILLNLLEYRQFALYTRIEAIVLEQLKAVSFSDIPSFDVKQRKILCRMLFNQGSDPVSIITILRALQQTGSSESIPAIKRMIREGHTEAVKQDARQCLYSIEWRQKEGNAHDTLLRASESADCQDELLRSAHSNTDTQVETLLRVPKEE